MSFDDDYWREYGATEAEIADMRGTYAASESGILEAILGPESSVVLRMAAPLPAHVQPSLVYCDDAMTGRREYYQRQGRDYWVRFAADLTAAQIDALCQAIVMRLPATHAIYRVVPCFANIAG